MQRILLTILSLFVLTNTLCGQTKGDGILIYRLNLSKAEGINFEFYEGGYLVAPATGGEASLILTRKGDSGSQLYALAHPAGSFFLAGSGENVKAAFRASSRAGSSSVSYLMLSLEDYTHLRGTVHVADPEDDMEPAADGSIGVVGLTGVEAFLERDRTRVANESSQGLAATIATLMKQLEAGGFKSEPIGE